MNSFRLISSKSFISILLLFISTTVYAQLAGELEYAPEGVPIPTIGTWSILLLSGILTGFSFFFMRNRHRIAALLFFSAVASMVALHGFVPEVEAVITATLLDKPQGGVVAVPTGYQEYENTSGVKQRITRVEGPLCNGVNPTKVNNIQAQSSILECVANTTSLNNGQRCFTDFSNCRITYRSGYYWVKADYPAAKFDDPDGPTAHQSVCAEFGLIATDLIVTVTWDMTLLNQLASDFGYTPVTDTDCCSPSLWCWDGDGGPHTTAGQCETHSIPNTVYFNYGSYSEYATGTQDPDERPVYTCIQPTP